ncbi:hypothetical protein D3C81_2258950 [compost metagenome]
MYQKDRSDDAAIHFRYPGPIMCGIEGFDEICKNPRNERLIFVIPAIFFGVKHGLPVDDPAKVASL